MSKQYHYASYDLQGKLLEIKSNISDFVNEEYRPGGIYTAIKTGKSYKNKIFIAKDKENDFEKEIEITNIIAMIDGMAFNRESQIAKYIGVSRQAV